VHTWWKIVPNDPYFEKHPEWYSLLGGKRVPGDVHGRQLCVTASGLADGFAANVIRVFDDDPKCRLMSISPNDGYGWCQCPACIDLDKRMCGGRTTKQGLGAERPFRGDRVFWFANEVATRVAEKHPDKKLLVLAYVNYAEPPDTVRPHPNVVPFLCHYAPADYARAINDPASEPNSQFGVPASGIGDAEEKGGRRCWNSDETGVGDNANGWATFIVRTTDHSQPIVVEMDVWGESTLGGIVINSRRGVWNRVGPDKRLSRKPQWDTMVYQIPARLLDPTRIGQTIGFGGADSQVWVANIRYRPLRTGSNVTTMRTRTADGWARWCDSLSAEIRNTKHEIRNKFEKQNPNDRNGETAAQAGGGAANEWNGVIE
jgi:hypothetical protein